MKLAIRQITKWAAIGFLLRALLMPFTMHGQDIVFINYFPMMLVTKGVWDPYGFISNNFSYFPFTYYGPVLFGLMSAANFIFIKVFQNLSLVNMLEIAGGMIGRDFYTADYVHAFLRSGLFKNLFIMKSPYLVFDFLIGALLLKLAYSDKMPIMPFKIWMLNIVVLQSVYAAGGAYLVPAFFITGALYAAVKKRSYLSVVLLSMGGATMLFPYFLIIPACLLLDNNWSGRCKLFAAAAATTLMLYIPFYFSSGTSVLGLFKLSHMQYGGFIKWMLRGIFVGVYAVLSFSAVKDSEAPGSKEKLLYYFAAVMFLVYATFPMRFRYFVFITPVLALIMSRHRKFAIVAASMVPALAFQWLTDRDLQLGLLAPINPEYFLNLPALQEVMGRFIDIDRAYKIIARAVPLVFLVCSFWIWRMLRAGTVPEKPKKEAVS